MVDLQCRLFFFSKMINNGGTLTVPINIKIWFFKWWCSLKNNLSAACLVIFISPWARALCALTGRRGIWSQGERRLRLEGDVQLVFDTWAPPGGQLELVKHSYLRNIRMCLCFSSKSYLLLHLKGTDLHLFTAVLLKIKDINMVNNTFINIPSNK